MAKPKDPGRPAGSPNKGSQFPRNEAMPHLRCTEAFNQVLQELASMDNVSRADVLHEALLQFAYRHRKSAKIEAYINKIV